ncbi:hypothetical protein JOE40_004082 [Arthrobacter sp. PvP102]|uniref:hypothetical protein n=1 Tax=unclassified Arthrobacter TaxID=235627 RepID=UPI001AE11700|nr:MULTISPECIES: hypothetical protein [unclassified Arthrobacter]MBP1234439.1 hypothetical protein [Arthrobacter sp. PvP103]MBP1239573.1 hypothetical protein [Arthrobacter sp. PvP102]
MRRSMTPGYGSSGPARSRATAAVGACLAVLLAACGPSPAPPGPGSAAATESSDSASAASTGTASGTAAGTATASATGTAVPPSATAGAPPAEPAPSGTSPSRLPSPTASGWKTFTTADRDLTFDYPGDWTIKDPAGKSPLGGVRVEVLNVAGKPMAVLETRIVTGSECVQQYPFAVLDSEPMTALAEKGVPDENAPRFMFETRGDASAPARTAETIAAYGITMIPEEVGTLACPIFLLFRWPPSGAMFGAGYDPANNSTPGDPSLPYWEKAKLYVETGEYRNIRRMITSLRPAR